MTDHSATRIRTADLTGNRRRPFDLTPGPEQLVALAQDLGLLTLSRLRLVGELRPQGRSDVKLEARLLAAGDQACVVTLAPVPFAIEVPVERLYVAGMEEPEGDEVEMPEDDSREPLPDAVDLEAVMAESLALALPDYPRAPGAELAQTVFAEPGTAPLTDEALRPFAGLAALKGKLDG